MPHENKPIQTIERGAFRAEIFQTEGDTRYFYDYVAYRFYEKEDGGRGRAWKHSVHRDAEDNLKLIGDVLSWVEQNGKSKEPKAA